MICCNILLIHDKCIWCVWNGKISSILSFYNHILCLYEVWINFTEQLCRFFFLSLYHISIWNGYIIDMNVKITILKDSKTVYIIFQTYLYVVCDISSKIFYIRTKKILIFFIQSSLIVIELCGLISWYGRWDT